MSEIFIKHLKKFTTIGEEDLVSIAAYFKYEKVRKKENLQLGGQICKSHYFVISGCLRKFFVNDKGIEQTTEFAIENWWITDNMAFEHRLPTEFFIQAVENSDVMSIDSYSQERLLVEFPAMERYFRFVYQRAYAAAQMRIKYLYDLSKEDYYKHFIKNYPGFVQRVPQYLLASFLGFTPEYLSELRGKIRS